MNYINKFWTGAIALTILASCADESLLDYTVEQPANFTELDYLKEYDVLKSYVDRSANANFKLGAGVSVDEFNKKAMVHSVMVSNFDELTAGWEMKHGAIVQNNGVLNTGRLERFITTAKESGISIYGHTLLWHANQNAKYLNGIIADREIEIDPDATEEVVDGLTDYSVDGFTGWVGDEVPVRPYVDNGVLVVENPSVIDPFYLLQFHVANGISILNGEMHKVTIRIKGTSSGSITLGLGTWGGRQNTQIPITEEWADVTAVLSSSATAGDAFVMLQSGNYAGVYEVASVKVTHEEALAVKWFTNMLTNSDVESDDVTNFFATEARNGPKAATIGAPGTGADGVGRAIVVQSGDAPLATHDTQFFVKAPQQLLEGDVYRFSMKYKADKPANSQSQSHNNPGGYLWWSMVGEPSFTTDWKEFTITQSISAQQAGASGMNTIAFNLAVLGEVNTYYFDDIVWEIEESGTSVPLTPEEKADTLTYALENWISGVMAVSKDYVKAWDVVNEPMDDGNPSELKTGEGKTLAEDEFYWQDYLGKDYAVMAFKWAAQYGNSDDKLFINDYNLEYNLDKCQGLIDYVEYIESQGARVDGIGTQMHINVDSDKEKIVQMFTMLAATGKLIKVSELDLGLAGGKKTQDATDEDYIAQADMYKWVVQKYLEIIPAAQQYGITLWSPNDSPANSSWRAGEPIGVWTEGFHYRKRSYAGVADGLSGAE